MQKDPQHNLRYRTFAPGEWISFKRNCYWLLQKGVVKSCSWTQEGTPITLGYWGKDDLIGQSLSLVYPYRVKCLTKVDAVSIPLSQTANMANLVQRHIQQTEELLCILRSHKVYQRLRKILLWLSFKFGQEIEIGKIIDLRLTHQELSEIVGATRVTITKLVNQLEQEGFLSRPGRNMIIVHGNM